MDNLESQTYEVFEKDPIKYRQYQEATRRALLDRVPDEKSTQVVSTVMVVGAGRGPLVACVLAAAQEAKRKVRVFAIEKNPNAIVTFEATFFLCRGEKSIILKINKNPLRPGFFSFF